MIRTVAAMLMVSMLVAACGVRADDIRQLPGVGHPPRYIVPGRPTTFEIDPAFTQAERVELAAAAAEVAPTLLVTFVDHDGDGVIVRGEPSFGTPLAADEAGAFSLGLFTMYVLPERCAPGELRPLVVRLLHDMVKPS